MMDERLKQRYISILTSHNHNSIDATKQKMTVLQNIETYLVEEDLRMIAQDKKWKEIFGTLECSWLVEYLMDLFRENV